MGGRLSAIMQILQQQSSRKKKTTTISIPQPLGFKLLKRVENSNSTIYNMTITDFTVGFIFAGSKTIHTSRSRIVLPKETLFILRHGSYCVSDTTDCNNQYCELLISIPALTLKYIMSNFSDTIARPNYTLYSSIVIPATDSRYLHPITELYQCDNLSDSISYIRLCELIYLMLESKTPEIYDVIQREITAESAKFSKTIMDNLYTDATLSNLAKLTNMSLTTFKQHFKEVFGLPPHKWIVEQHIEHALLLLLTTDKSIDQICTECRFANTSHFIRLFKQRFNSTPRKFRQLYLRQGL